MLIVFQEMYAKTEIKQIIRKVTWLFIYAHSISYAVFPFAAAMLLWYKYQFVNIIVNQRILSYAVPLNLDAYWSEKMRDDSYVKWFQYY